MAYEEIKAFIDDGLDILRIGGATAQTLVINKLIITEIPQATEPPDNLYIGEINFMENYIEIRNPTDKPISTKGLYISNNSNALSLW